MNLSRTGIFKNRLPEHVILDSTEYKKITFFNFFLFKTFLNSLTLSLFNKKLISLFGWSWVTGEFFYCRTILWLTFDPYKFRHIVLRINCYLHAHTWCSGLILGRRWLTAWELTTTQSRRSPKFSRQTAGQNNTKIPFFKWTRFRYTGRSGSTEKMSDPDPSKWCGSFGSESATLIYRHRYFVCVAI